MVESMSIQEIFFTVGNTSPIGGDIMVENEMYKKDRYSAVGRALRFESLVVTDTLMEGPAHRRDVLVESISIQENIFIVGKTSPIGAMLW